MLTELTIREYMNRLGSKQPAPGGGSAAALCGLTGVALLEMVIELSAGRTESVSDHEFLTASLTLLASLHQELERLVDQDAAAFSEVIAAYKLPKVTPLEQQTRQAAIQQALSQAAAIPLAIGRACLAALEVARSLCGKVNVHVISDLAVGALAAHSGAAGAVLNTAINLPSLKDRGLAAEFADDMRRIRQTATTLLGQIEAEVYQEPMFTDFSKLAGSK